MKTIFRMVLLGAMGCAAGVVTLHADEALRRVQQSLRDQGFYYGSVDGSLSDATTQAIRRYQIRNGLTVNGQLDAETRQAIDKSGNAARASGGTGAADQGDGRGDSSTINGTAPPRRVTPANPVSPDQGYRRPTVRPVPEATPPDNASADEDNTAPASRGRANAEEETRPANPGSDGRPDLRARPDEAPAERGGTLPRGAVLPSARLSELFASTPFEFAPPPVQVDVLRRAQATLTRQGFYDGPANGVPSPLVTEALSNYQGVSRLRKTGRLDVSTLGRLRLMPER